MTRLRTILEFTALILTIAVCGAMLVVIGKALRTGPAVQQQARSAVQRPEDPIPMDPASLDGAQVEGNRTAKIAVIEYSDFQCPYCGRFATETLPEFEKRYVKTGKVLFAFRQFPLESIHQHALKAAEAAECAADQGQFWKMQALTFGDQQHLDDEALRDRAAKAGLDLSRFDKCIQGDVASRVRSDEQAGKRMLVAGTPTFFFGTIQSDGRVKILKRMSGAVPIDQFAATVDAVMATPGVVARKTH